MAQADAEVILKAVFAPANTMDPAVVEQMLTIAFQYRPRCLTEPMQDEAQAYYAAYLLEPINNAQTGGSSQAPVTPLIREKEGQLEREYANPSSGATTTTDQSFYGRWKRLADVCSRYTRAIR